ncbi:MAG: type II toxin-antitoxin system VapC family toxin [Deltaproteobacteria bacterium]|nr:MAG: type II toxin-antitoxin system VapC family toxin [Deltaproteobacteria bacterium]
MKSYVLDTSALLTFQLNESGSDVVEEILLLAKRKKAHVYTSFITWTEVYYITSQRLGQNRALETLVQMKCLPIKRIESDEEQTLTAGDLKSHFSISLGDAFVAALAIQKKAVLIHKDPEFEPIKSNLIQQALPYKNLH